MQPSPYRATKAATDEFGPPTELTAGFAGELAVARARYTVGALLLTGPIVGVWWLLLLAPTSWWRAPTQLLAAIPALPIVAAAVIAGLAVFATTGSLARWLPETAPARALHAAVALTVVCIGIDLAALATVAVRAATASHPAWQPVAGMAIAASLARLALAARAVRTCRHTAPAS